MWHAKVNTLSTVSVSGNVMKYCLCYTSNACSLRMPSKYLWIYHNQYRYFAILHEPGNKSSTFSASSESSALNSGPLQWEQHNITYRINTVGCREVNYTFSRFFNINIYTKREITKLNWFLVSSLPTSRGSKHLYVPFLMQMITNAHF